jgi:hypothetical protein
VEPWCSGDAQRRLQCGAPWRTFEVLVEFTTGKVCRRRAVPRLFGVSQAEDSSSNWAFIDLA